MVERSSKTERVVADLPAEPTSHEARQRAADAVALQRDRAGGRVGVTSPGYLYVDHPDHGEPVVFVPGELLPGWAVEALDAGRAERGEDRLIREAAALARKVVTP